jgi:hypothetical protein
VLQPTEEQLGHWKLLERFIELLDKSGGGIAPGRRERHGLRELDKNIYFGLFLFGLFNPVVTSMRSLCAASRLPRVARTVGCNGPVAISGFSDAQRVFSPEILEPVMRELLAKSLARNLPATRIGRITPEMLRVFDSTLWKVVPRMGWAQWRFQDVEQRAIRLHVKLRLADLQPDQTELAEARICERAAMRRMIKPGEFYLGDRNYGTDFRIFGELEAAGCGYVLRLLNTAILEVVVSHPVPAAARAAGVISDAMMKIGRDGAGGIRRVVILRRPGMKEDVILVTSEPHEVLAAEEVTGLYRHRWEVEMFFRWLKCLAPCRHWFAESREGVRIQIYLVLIKALMLAELTGRKPNKRMMELLHWHQIGWADDRELSVLLEKEESARQRREAKKKA